MNPRKVLLAVAILLSTGVIVMTVMFGWAAFGDHEKSGVHLPKVGWLPATASDISYYQNRNLSGTECYEFHIARADFETLARERRWQMAPAAGQRISRYKEMLRHGGPGAGEPSSVTIANGLFYEKRGANGAGITVGYDDTTSTAYVSKSNR